MSPICIHRAWNAQLLGCCAAVLHSQGLLRQMEAGVEARGSRLPAHAVLCWWFHLFVFCVLLWRPQLHHRKSFWTSRSNSRCQPGQIPLLAAQSTARAAPNLRLRGNLTKELEDRPVPRCRQAGVLGRARTSPCGPIPRSLRDCPCQWKGSQQRQRAPQHLPVPALRRPSEPARTALRAVATPLAALQMCLSATSRLSI